MPLTVEVHSFIRMLSHGGSLSTYQGNVADVLRQVRSECSQQGETEAEWAQTIRDHGVVPDDHPFLRLCQQLNLPEDHPLRTLGSWAFGFGNPWIVIQWVRTEDGRMIGRDQFDPFYRAQRRSG